MAEQDVIIKPPIFSHLSQSGGSYYCFYFSLQKLRIKLCANSVRHPPPFNSDCLVVIEWHWNKMPCAWQLFSSNNLDLLGFFFFHLSNSLLLSSLCKTNEGGEKKCGTERKMPLLRWSVSLQIRKRMRKSSTCCHNEWHRIQFWVVYRAKA